MDAFHADRTFDLVQLQFKVTGTIRQWHHRAPDRRNRAMCVAAT
jgi:hypothetical protein